MGRVAVTSHCVKVFSKSETNHKMWFARNRARCLSPGLLSSTGSLPRSAALTDRHDVLAQLEGKRCLLPMRGLGSAGGQAVKPCATSERTSPLRNAKALWPHPSRACRHCLSVGFPGCINQLSEVYLLPQTLTTAPEVPAAARTTFGRRLSESQEAARRLTPTAGVAAADTCDGGAGATDRATRCGNVSPRAVTRIDDPHWGHGYVHP